MIWVFAFACLAVFVGILLWCGTVNQIEARRLHALAVKKLEIKASAQAHRSVDGRERNEAETREGQVMIGDNAGRSRRHPTGQGAVGRSTDRQRQGMVPPPGEEWVEVTTAERYRSMISRSMLISVGLVAAGNFLVLWSERWFELLGVGLLMAAVVVAGVSRPWRLVRADLVLEDKSEALSLAQRRSARRQRHLG